MEIEQRRNIVHKYLQNPTWSMRLIARELKISPSTVRDVIKRYKTSLSVERHPKTVQKRGPRDPATASKIRRDVVRNPKRSYTKRAEKLGTTVSVVRTEMERAGYKAYRVIKVPNRNEKQEKAVKTRVRLLYNRLVQQRDQCILMDDETYVYSDNAQARGNDVYYAKTRLGVAEKHKFKKLDKFPQKFLIWQGICSCGKKTDAFIAKGTINADLYLQECLKKRVLPFIRKHRSPVLFWPDLATAHYARKVQEWYREENIEFVEKSMNPPNCPELRPIERYWAIMKSKLSGESRFCRTAPAMLKYWNRHCSTITIADVQTLMRGVKSKVRQMVRGNRVD